MKQFLLLLAIYSLIVNQSFKKDVKNLPRTADTKKIFTVVKPVSKVMKDTTNVNNMSFISVTNRFHWLQ